MKHRIKRSAGPIVTANIDTTPAEPSRPTARMLGPIELRRLELMLAAEAIVDVRTAQRVLREGADVIRGQARDRVRAAADALGIELPHPGIAAELRTA